MTKTYMFNLTDNEEKLADEISLAGVIAGKVAKGDYVENPDYDHLRSVYASCLEVNAKLHSKLNRVRRALSAEELVTERPEDELE